MNLKYYRENLEGVQQGLMSSRKIFGLGNTSLENLGLMRLAILSALLFFPCL